VWALVAILVLALLFVILVIAISTATVYYAGIMLLRFVVTRMLAPLRRETYRLRNLLSTYLSAIKSMAPAMPRSERHALFWSMARICVTLGDHSQGAQYLETASQNLPPAEDANSLKFHQYCAEFWADAQRGTRAIDEYQQLSQLAESLRLAEYVAFATAGRARCYIDQGDFKSAVALLRSVPHYDLGLHEAVCRRTWGRLFLELGRTEDAIAHLTSSIECYGPTSAESGLVETYLLLGEAYRTGQRDRHALQAYRCAEYISRRLTSAELERRALWGAVRSYQGLIARSSLLQQHRAIHVRVGRRLGRQWDSVVEAEPLADGCAGDRVASTLRRVYDGQYTAKLAEAASMLGASAPEVTGIGLLYLSYAWAKARLRAVALERGLAERNSNGTKKAKLDSDFWCSLFLTSVCGDSGVAWLCRQPDDRITDAAEEHKCYMEACTWWHFDRTRANESMDRCIAIVEAKRCSISETDTQLFYFATARGYYTQYVRQLMTGWRVGGDSGACERAWVVSERYRGRWLAECVRNAHGSFSNTDVDVAQLQQLLEPGECVVSFFLADVESYAWLIHRGGVVGSAIRGRSTIEGVCSLFVEHCSSTGSVADVRREYLDEAFTLRQLLFGRLPIEEFTAVYVVPDGKLWSCPFSALLAGSVEDQAAGWQTGANGLACILIPSAETLQLLRRASETSRGGVAVFADPVFSITDDRVSSTLDSRYAREGEPFNIDETTHLRLPYTKVEADGISKVCPPGSVVCNVGFSAAKDALLRMDLSEVRVVHFATHGVRRSDGTCGLVLSTVRDCLAACDGWLGCDEIARLQMRGKIVVLSACESGTGVYRDGEGAIGLAQAFLRAGATCVVGTLWRVSDIATAEFMINFYRHMMVDGGVSVGTALYRAQGDLRVSGEWSRPCFWAGFVVLGDAGRVLELS
jgi:tetratricopeptide (TPR) repeat protein